MQEKGNESTLDVQREIVAVHILLLGIANGVVAQLLKQYAVVWPLWIYP